MRSLTVTQQQGVSVYLTLPSLLLATRLFSILYVSQFGLFLSRFGNLVPGAFLSEGRGPSPFLRKSPGNEVAVLTLTFSLKGTKIFYSIKCIPAPVRSAIPFFSFSTKCWLSIGVSTYKISSMTEFKGTWVDSRFDLMTWFELALRHWKNPCKVNSNKDRPMPLVTWSRSKLCD